MKIQNYPNEFRAFKTNRYWIDAGYACLAEYYDGTWISSEVWPGNYIEITELELLVMTGTSREQVLKDVIPAIQRLEVVHDIKHAAMTKGAARTGVQENLISSFSCGSSPPAATKIT